MLSKAIKEVNIVINEKSTEVTKDEDIKIEGNLGNPKVIEDEGKIQRVEAEEEIHEASQELFQLVGIAKNRTERRQQSEHDWLKETRNMKTRGSLIKEENDKLERELQQIMEFNKKHYYYPKPIQVD